MKTPLRFSVLSSFCLLSLWLALAPAKAQSKATPASASLCSGRSLDLNTLITAPGGSTVSWSLKPPATAISAGFRHSLALLANGQVIAWGDNFDGQTSVPVSATPATAIAAGGYHSLDLLANGSVVGWGDNGQGRAEGYDAQPLVSTTVSPTATQTYYYLTRNSSGSITTSGSVTVGGQFGGSHRGPYSAQRLHRERCGQPAHANASPQRAAGVAGFGRQLLRAAHYC